AACRLGWTPGSVRGRLERGRKRLHARLARRGLTLSALLGAAEAGRASGPVAPRGTAAATARAARLFPANPPPPPRSGPAHRTALARGALTTMLWTRMQLAALAALVVTVAALAAGLAGRPAWATAPARVVEAQPPGPARAARPPEPRGEDKPRADDDDG